jgi:arginase family enzyme
VGVPESAGLSGAALCEALKQFKGDTQFLGMEISEFSPEFDQKNKTQQLISKLLCCIYGNS